MLPVRFKTGAFFDWAETVPNFVVYPVGEYAMIDFRLTFISSWNVNIFYFAFIFIQISGT